MKRASISYYIDHYGLMHIVPPGKYGMVMSYPVETHNGFRTIDCPVKMFTIDLDNPEKFCTILPELGDDK